MEAIDRSGASSGAISGTEYLRRQRADAAAEKQRREQERIDRRERAGQAAAAAAEAEAAYLAAHPKPTTAEVQAAFDRATAAVAEEEQAAEKESDALAVAEALVAEISARIDAHDGGEGSEELAKEESVAQVKVRSLTRRLSDRMDALASKREALTEATTALDAIRSAEAKTALDTADEAVALAINEAAPKVAAAFVAVEPRRAEAVAAWRSGSLPGSRFSQPHHVTVAFALAFTDALEKLGVAS